MEFNSITHPIRVVTTKPTIGFRDGEVSINGSAAKILNVKEKCRVSLFEIEKRLYISKSENGFELRLNYINYNKRSTKVKVTIYYIVRNMNLYRALFEKFKFISNSFRARLKPEKINLKAYPGLDLYEIDIAQFQDKD